MVFMFALSPILPAGLSFSGPFRRTRVQLLTDLTYLSEGSTVTEQSIFEAIFEVIEGAQAYLVLDLFLFNGDYPAGRDYPQLSKSVVDALIDRKRRSPELPILVITDPINTFYGISARSHFARLEKAGIELVFTDLDRLPDSNPGYSFLYRSLADRSSALSRFTLPNVLAPGKERMGLDSYARLLNFKANHRKVVLSEREAVVSSANPHDASAPNANFGFRVDGAVLADLLASERAVYEFSAPGGTFFTALLPEDGAGAGAAPEGATVPEAATAPGIGNGKGHPAEVSLRTEGGIKEAALELLAQAHPGDLLVMGMFYLAEQELLAALKETANRGVAVQVILDKNKDAFGRSKTGLPNLPVAFELAEAKVEVRWAATHGEQYHPKFLGLIAENQIQILAGSGNFTRRNISNFNLETSLLVRSESSELQREFLDYWQRQWSNQGALFTEPLRAYKKPKPWDSALYRFQEKTGLGTF